MPRETVQSYQSDPNHDMPWVSIGWQAQLCDVQMAVLQNPVEVEKYLTRILESVSGLNELQTAQLTDALTSVESPLRGWHTSLDRGAVNRLIRILRKARDQSFGADA